MDEAELKKRMAIMRYIGSRGESHDRQPAYTNMTPSQKDEYIALLEKDIDRYRDLLEEAVDGQKKIQERLDKVLEQLEESNKEKAVLTQSVARLMEELGKSQESVLMLQKHVSDLLEQATLDKSILYGRKSCKKRAGRKAEPVTREEEKSAFDGTPESLPTREEVEENADATERKQITNAGKKGMKYSTMNAASVIDYPCDESQLPKGAVIMRRYTQSVYDQVSYIVEHRTHYVVYKMPGQDPVTVHIPMPGDEKKEEQRKQIIPVPHTHVTARMLSRLVMNKHQLDVPLYREIVRMIEDRFKVTRQTLVNYLSVGVSYLKEVLPYLKDDMLSDNPNLHCDETWHRVCVDGVCKRYIWCLVNKAKGIVYFFYEKGSRGSDVIKKFIGDRKIKSIQTDAYCGYSFFDDEGKDTEHLYCLAHARAKFCYAMDQGKDQRAKLFIDEIGWLYAQEKAYKEEGLNAEQIHERRNRAQTTEHIVNLYTRMQELITDKMNSELMQKALNYLSNGWRQLMAFRNSGEYDIDNLESERCIRPLTVSRNNAPVLGSEAGAENLAAYMTFIETCKKQGISPLCYFERFFSVVARNDGKGIDYSLMTPKKLMTQS